MIDTRHYIQEARVNKQIWQLRRKIIKATRVRTSEDMVIKPTSYTHAINKTLNAPDSQFKIAGQQKVYMLREKRG